ncbi:hypothetical protein D3C84_357690 [compost metagenome]
MHIGVRARQPGIDRIVAGFSRIEGFVLEPGLLVLEGPGGFHFHFHPQKQRHGIRRHLRPGKTQQLAKIQGGQGFGRRDGGHAGPAVGVADFYAIGHRFGDMRMQQQDIFNLGGRNVLTFPTVGIAKTINELSMAEADVPEQVTGIEVAVAFFKHIMEHDLRGFLRVGVAVQRRLVIDPCQQQAFLPLTDLLHEALAVADRRATVVGVFDQLPGHQRKTDGVVKIQNVGEADVAVTGGIQFTYVVDPEALLELAPDAGAQTVADHLDHRVVTVVGAGRLINQITAQLTDVTDGGRPVFTHIVPELTGAEFAPNGKARRAIDRRTPAHAQPRGVVQRQGAIDDVPGTHVQRDHAEAGGRAHPATVLEHPSLGQPGRAGGVDIEARVVEVHLLAAERVFA